MIAHHPTTGQSIRILRTDLQISSDVKTLVWMRAGFQESHRWQRWYSVISEPGAIYLCNGTISSVIIPDLTHIEEWISVFPTIFHSESETLLIAPNAVIDALSARGCQSDRTVPWEDLYDSYPYLGEPVLPSDPIEKVIISVAHILRMSKLVWTSPCLRDDLPLSARMQYDAWVKTCGGTLVTVPHNSDDAVVPRTWLIQQYFRHSNTRRAREIFNCLEKNIACKYIDEILLLNEQEYSELPQSPKLHTSTLSHRLTYYDVFKAVREQVPAGSYVIFSNSDIWFNHTLKQVWDIGLYERNLFLALLRWEDSAEGEPTIYGPRADSQDAWIFARDALTFDIQEKDLGFPFGKAGCDNAIALIMLSKRFLVCNPAYSIKTMHIHSSNIRNYDPKDILYRTHYLYVEPTAIQPMKILKNIKDLGKLPPDVAKAWSSRTLGTSFPRPILGIRDEDVSAICAGLRVKNHVYCANEQNLYTPPPESTPLYNFKGGCFVSADGLVSSFKDIYIGNHPLWEQGWSSSRQTTLMPSIHVPHMIACPYDPSWNNSLGLWALHYLPRVLAIRRLVSQAGLPVPEFLVPQLQDIGSFLTDCVWNTEHSHITVTPMLQDMNYYSECVWAVPPTEKHSDITVEDIELLRELMPTGATNTDKPVAVFCVEDDEHALCTRGWAEETSDKIFPKGWTIRYIGQNDLPSVRRKALQDASWVFGSGAALDWIWYMPKGASVMEFMSSAQCDDTHIHLAGAAGLRYVVGRVQDHIHIIEQRQNALMDVGRAIKSHGFKEMMNVVHSLFKDKPRILMPSGKGLEGIHNHSGNGFREMAHLWAERGYVNLVQTEDSHYVWWGGIGDVLLYDRESPRWWFTIPPYQMALFGNCALPGPDKHKLRQSVWSFWPNSPRAVETMVSRVENMRGYDSRPIGSIFLGRVANGVQKSARCGTDWASVIDVFSMPIDSRGEAYPYTQEQYLAKLCSSRYGLSLPGDGQLCHREIEYFASGCVPIITDGMDMSGFLVAPIEGVHYFRASSPADVKRIVETTPAHKWAAMSAAGRNWWRNYASAEGLFRLTWARIEQCKPYYNVGIPQNFQFL